MSGREVNGRRLAASFGSWSGTAGVQDRAGGLLEVAFRADFKKVREVETGTLGGQAIEVIGAAKSDFVAGMVVLTCRPATEGGQ